MLPSLDKAKKLFEALVYKTNIINVKKGLPKGTSAKHYQNVAYVAAHIALKAEMNVQKAYILGLLHDYGEVAEDSNPKAFHGTAGYDEMMLNGYDEVAQICLSHSFFDKNFNPEDTSYPSKEIIRAKEILKNKDFDDYDKLIQLADLMSSGVDITTVEERISKLAIKYNIRSDLVETKMRAAKELKMYFDNKCNCDIYQEFNL